MNQSRYILCLLLISGVGVWSDVFGQNPLRQISIQATGTGTTTGDIATLVIHNKRNTPLHILPQRVFIPSSGQYQPYLADIPSTLVAPGKTDTVTLKGYCTDARLPSAPSLVELIPMEKWIPIRQPDSTLAGNGTYLVTRHSVVPFTKDHISYIIISAAYKPLYPAPDSTLVIQWPGTEIPVGGTLDHVSRPDLYATVMCRALELLETEANDHERHQPYTTPFTVDSLKERQAVIQQLLWMYASALAGKKYSMEEFSGKVYEQFKTKSKLNSIPALEKQKLDEGILEFWNVFISVARTTHLFHVNIQPGIAGVMVDVPVDTIPYPWSMVPLVETIMKPYFVKAVPVKPASPVLPIISASSTVGSLLLIAFYNQETAQDCGFTLAAESTPSACHLSNGTIQLTVSPDSVYRFAWSSGDTLQNLVGVAPGMYMVTVTQPGTTCMQTAAVTVDNIDTPIMTEVISTDADCGMHNGSASPSVNPPGIYAYAWSNGSQDQVQSNLSPGVYTLTVTADGTCGDTVTVEIHELPPAFTVDVAGMDAHCGSQDGSAEVTVSPEGQYQYAWSNGSSNSQMTNLAPGHYSLTVSLPGSNCFILDSVTIGELPASFTLLPASIAADCGWNNGSASITVDPPGDYMYLWSNDQSGTAVAGLPPGTYSVTVTQTGTTCSQAVSIMVDSLPPAFHLSYTATASDCGQNNGTATVLVDPPGAYQYIWPNNWQDATATQLAAGTYEVTVSIPGTNCTQQITVLIDQVPIDIDIYTSTTKANCNQADGTATVDSITGADNYSVSAQWSDGQTGMQAIQLAPGTYTVTLFFEAPTCAFTLTDTVMVGQESANWIAGFTTTEADCGFSNGGAAIQVDPPGDYTYLWSNQQTGPALQQVPAGTYQVTVSDTHGCFLFFSVDIGQHPVNFIDITGTLPGNCAGDGEVTFTLTSPGSGPLNVEVVRQSDTYTIMLQLLPGAYSLSSYLPVESGAYWITAFDPVAGPGCADTVSVTVADMTPALMTNPDTYVTSQDQPVSGNFISNDSGLGLFAIATTNAIGGTVTFSANGDFTFVPGGGFSGEATFLYTVQDACGNTASANVTIIVNQVICDFTISTVTIPANCGVSNGTIQVNVNESGSYAYSWNTGANGNVLGNVSAGNYTVTITDINLGCSLAFTIPLGQYPADYIQNATVNQPTCTTEAEIQLTLTVPGPQNMLTMSVTHPGGTNVFSVSPGLIHLSDYITLAAGSYSIDVFIGNPGPSCMDHFNATINATPYIAIQTEVIFPPSVPGGNDGEATVIVTVPGQSPYTILLNTVNIGQSNDGIIEIYDLETGMYTVQIIDANGCASNILILDVPPATGILSFGATIGNLPVLADTREQAEGKGNQWTGLGLYGTFHYCIGKSNQALRLLFIPGLATGDGDFRNYLEGENRVTLYRYAGKNHKAQLQGGFGFRNQVDLPGHASAYLSLTASSTLRFKNAMIIQSEIALRGWSTFETPQWRLLLTFPACR